MKLFSDPMWDRFQLQPQGSGGASAYDQYVWPTWAETVLGRRVTARNFRVLLDELAAKGDFASYREGMLLTTTDAMLRVQLVQERLDAGAPAGSLLLNFVRQQRVDLVDSMRSAESVASWAKGAVERIEAKAEGLKSFAIEALTVLEGYWAALSQAWVKLIDMAVAAGIQLEQMAKRDRSFWEELMAFFRKYIPDPPESGLGWLLLFGLGAVAVAGFRK